MLNTIFKKKVKTEKELEIETLKQELDECKYLMQRNDTFFNMAVDESLIDSKIYERISLSHQYDYIIKQIKYLENPEENMVKTGEK